MNRVLNMARQWFQPTHTRRVLFFLSGDVFLIALSMGLAFFLRFEWRIPTRYLDDLWVLILIAVAVKVPIFYLQRLYHLSWSYVSVQELLSVFKGVLYSSSLLGAAFFVLRPSLTELSFPRSILFIDFFLTLLFIGGLRSAKRIWLQFARRPLMKGRRTLIVGAGDAGEQLVRSLKREERPGFWPIGLIDDNPAKQGVLIHGVPVLGPRTRLRELIQRWSAEAVIIAMPSAPSRVIQEAVELARKGGVSEIKIVPFLSELYTGEVKVSELREVRPEDLLGREPVAIDTQTVQAFLRGNRVLITGAAGSIGSELCRQALRFEPQELLALDIDETGLFNLGQELERRFPSRNYRIIVGDVRDRAKIEAVLKIHRPQVIFHAAAYKHVPIMEAFPEEAVKTNIFGTQIVLEEACRAGTEAFVLISTDKAVNPVSVMGMTKRIAEMVMLEAGRRSSTRCIAVRFGNVLGSRGSVLPLFMEQIRRGGPITVTHPEMERYFMTTAEAVLLVIQAAAMGRGGEVFVLDMGKPIKVLELARELIRFYGLEPDKDIPIVFTGVRPGEKLKEEIFMAEEGTEATKHKQIFMAKMRAHLTEDKLAEYLQKLEELVNKGDSEQEVKSVLRQMIFSKAPARSFEDVPHLKGS